MILFCSLITNRLYSKQNEAIKVWITLKIRTIFIQDPFSIAIISSTDIRKKVYRNIQVHLFARVIWFIFQYLITKSSNI